MIMVPDEPTRLPKNLQDLVQELIKICVVNKGLTDLDLLRLQRRYLRRKGAAQPFYLKSEILEAFTRNSFYPMIQPPWKEYITNFLQVKPVRTQSGVATVTVLTKPWPCPGKCIFCPSEARMPKSYLANEPGAQRAENNYFDPFLQVTSRLTNLAQMGHDLSKVELIVLGGTWDNYPLTYRRWFIKRLFDALNDFGKTDEAKKLNRFYQNLNKKLAEKHVLPLTNNAHQNEQKWRHWQEKLDSGELTYNQLMQKCYTGNAREKLLSVTQTASWRELALAQRKNRIAVFRNVGLVIETRPDLITVENLTTLRRLGCTKVQIGVQSVNDHVLSANQRGITRAQNARAFALLRLFGFKIHAHFMANLYGSTPEQDIQDYQDFMTSADFLPDEVKIYPCSLIKSAQLMDYYHDGRWQPYDEKVLLDVLTHYLVSTPAFVRVTRMIRDISSDNIVVGNKKTNFRQLVEANCKKQNLSIEEIRSREVRHDKLDLENLYLREIRYQTRVSDEFFLEYVNNENRIAGFLRLSLPKKKSAWPEEFVLPEDLGTVAMIREVHVYGVVAALQVRGNYQHTGFGRRLVNRAKEIAKAFGFTRLKVISAVGTHEYYGQKLGFKDSGLYQEIVL
ncbi:MAG: tRNA uridine(34) 5-carboxymethylaminomethyl modification radical SAM/GNAT enzyme Elp3 [bacterium]|nr:tRNA uridine(34) 5-carboxymethylaminomethyl modification radical SAM/GNAT enzyme Elp3 [bacterium]